MLVFKYGFSDEDSVIKFNDMTLRSFAAVKGEALYGVDIDTTFSTVHNVIHDIGDCTRCLTVVRGDNVVDDVTEKIMSLGVLAGTSLMIPSALLQYVENIGEKVYYDPLRYHETHYMYGVFNGRNKVEFYNGSILAQSFYPENEAIYRVSGGKITDRIEIGDIVDTRKTCTKNDRVFDDFRPGLEIFAPVGMDVKIPRSVWSTMDRYGEVDALFVPIHVNGDDDWVREEAPDQVAYSPKEAYEKCKHLSGRERFAALVPLLNDSVYALGDYIGEDSVLDVYGTKVVCSVRLSQDKNMRYCVPFKNGNGLAQAMPADSEYSIELDDEFTVRNGQVFITDRPVQKGSVIKTRIGSMHGNVVLIEVPLDVAPIEECMRRHSVHYVYGKFDGHNKVELFDGALPVSEYYREGEAVYRVENGKVTHRLDMPGTKDVCQMNVKNNLVYDKDRPGLEVWAPVGCDVRIPRRVRFAMDDYGDTDALFIPVRVDGTRDWLDESESNLVRKSIDKAFAECKHLTGPERFKAMMPYLKGVEVYCLGDLTDRYAENDYPIVDVYGVEVPCNVVISNKKDVRYKVNFKDGKSLMMTDSAVYPQDITLDSEFTERGEQVVITDRPIKPGTRVSTCLNSMFGDVILIEVPPELAVEGFDILPELQRLCSDEEYRKKVSEDIQKVFMKLPPSQRRQEFAIAQVCQLATSLVR